MDPLTALMAIPGVGPYLPYVTIAMALASVLATVLPPPVADGNTAYAMIYNTVNFLAINFGHAKNASAPVQAAPGTRVDVEVVPAVTIPATVPEPKP